MGDTVDTILAAGATFDWISPTLSVLQGLVNGPSHTFLIPHAACPMSGREINVMLNRRGIKNWGHMIVDGTLTISVRTSDARQAEGALKNHGVPIENSLPSSVKGKAPSGKAAPQPQAQKVRALQANANVRWWHCDHCGNFYRKWKTKCSGCGAQLQPGK